MAYGKIDIEDAILGTVFGAGALEQTNLLNMTFVPTSTDLGASLMTLGGVDITFAFVLSLAALVGAYATNRVGSNRSMNVDTDLSNILRGRSGVETYIVGATVLVVLALGVDLLGARDFVINEPIAGAAVVVLEGAGYYVVSYLG